MVVVPSPARVIGRASSWVRSSVSAGCLLGALALSGCFRSHERPRVDGGVDAGVDGGVDADAGAHGDAGADDGGASSRFVGRWLAIDTELRAVSGASVYELAPDGTAELIDVWAVPAGGVSHAATARSCELGGRWWSTDPSTLWLTSECTDGVARDVQLGFPSDEASNATGSAVEVLTVDGEPGWGPLEGVRAWAWLHCDRGDESVPLIADCLASE